MNSNSSRSANSSGKSKRSHASNSNSANKKRTPDQKTLGMAWGANALSSSKTSSRKSPFIDFGSYMIEKNRKLQNQFDTDASSTSLGGDPNAVKPLFNGVSIFVDGFTVPSNQELRSYMLKYGGRYENYFSRSRVTHIICSNLPDSKLKNIRSFSRGLPVVKPMWILDCVAANKLLNWVPYQLDQLVNATHKQTKLSTFFARKSSSTVDKAETPVNSRVQPETYSPTQSDAIAEEITCEVGESLKYDSECSGEVSSSGGEKFCELTNEESAFIDEKSSELREGVQNSTDIKDEKIVPAEFESSLYRSSASANDCLNDKKVHTSCNPRSAVSSSSNEYHSTRGDPNFVENYFKSSRLHFIGTWRKRYRKCFPSSTANVKNDNPTKAQRTAILHVDMDCFFVAVVIRDHPELQDKPVAVCHSDSPRGTAEISSANYPARDYGVRAGIFVRDAKALCPHLVILPYNFTAYEEVADQFYNILHKYCNKVQAVSCDEAFLDVTDREDEDPEHIASVIRKEIIETTGCTASAGVSGNMLMARLATRAAKPNGQCYISPEKVESFLDDLPIKALPGIGRVLEEKLKKLYIETSSQLRAISKESLRRDFGAKTGDMLWNYSRGIDNRQVGELQETKSVGAEVNWGVRFNDFKDSQNFLVNLCNEVASRLQECGVQGRTITLKVKKRRSNAGEPTKYMGCGECDNLSHSMTVPIATDETDVLQRISKQLFSSFQLDVKEIRGMGMQVTRLESADMGGQGRERNALRTWLASAPVITKEASCSLSERVDEGAQWVDGKFKTTLANHGEKGPDGNSSYFFSKSTASCRMQTNQSSNETSSRGGPSTLPPIVDLDMGVIESLPPEIFSEMNEMYGGKLSEFIDRKNGKGVCTLSTEEVGGGKKGKGSFIQHYVHLDKATNKYKAVTSLPHLCWIQKSSDTDAEKVHQGNNAEINMAVHWSGKQKLKQESQCLAASEAGTSNLRVNTIDAAHVDLMPASLSQVDISILQQLPEELKVDILESLPAHRGPELSGDYPMVGSEPSCDIARMKDVENNSGGLNSVSRNNLWVGSPPEWVDKFDASNHLILNVFADMYNKCRPPCLLSSILQSLISVLPLLMDASNDLEDEVVSRLCELLRQYIELNIKNDMEEIYLCFRLLRRFFLKSRVFFQVYDQVLPYLQVRLVADGIVSSVRTIKNPAPFIADPVVQVL